jgi:ribosomal protein S18 acetylase RimI-like enzyme
MKIETKQIDHNETELVVELFNKYRIFYDQVSDLNLAKKYIQERLNKNESIIFIAFVDTGSLKMPIGFTQLYPNYSSIRAVKNWTLNDLFVEQEYRKMGVGELLINKVIDFAEKNEAIKIELSTRVDNKTAQSLYEKVGFERQQPDEEYYTYTLTLK